MRRQSQRFLLGIAISVAIHAFSLFLYHCHVSTVEVDDYALFNKRGGTILYIHVGPVKTASSSIQCNLQSNPHLHASSYYYLGKYEQQCRSSNPIINAAVDEAREQAGGKAYISGFDLVFQYFLRGWLRPSLLEERPSFWKFVEEWKEGMELRHRRKMHTIFSAEEFCGLRKLSLGKSSEDLASYDDDYDYDDNDDARGNGTQSEKDDRVRWMVDFLQSTPQHIRFQVMYRDYFDWVASIFSWSEYSRVLGKTKQNFKVFGADEEGSTMSSIVDWKYLDNVLSAKVWDDDETDDGVAADDDENNSIGCSPYNMWMFLKNLLPYFDKGRASIQILDFFHHHNIHDERGESTEDDIGTKYVCNLPNATTACERTRRIRFRKSNPTPIDSIHADRIAMAAWKAGLFANPEFVDSRRKAVNNAILRRIRVDLNASIADLPLECLSKRQVEELFQTSVDMAKAMLGSKALDVDSMRTRFQRAVTQKKFCSVNTTAIIEDESWKEFFQMKSTAMTRHDYSSVGVGKVTDKNTKYTRRQGEAPI